MKYLIYPLLGLLVSNACAGGTVTIVARTGISNPIYVSSGWTTVNYTAQASVAFHKFDVAELQAGFAEIDVWNSSAALVLLRVLCRTHSL
jgi:hypothetical protein